MLGCTEAQPLLGLLLTGGLEPNTLESLLTHLEGCRSCGGELAALQRLEEQLRGLGSRRVRVRWRWLALVALLLLGLGLGWAFSSGPAAHLQSGRVASQALGFVPGQQLPYREPLRALESAAVGLVDGSRVWLHAATRLSLQRPRRLRLDSGEVFCEVVPGVDTFVVETPLGEVLVIGTSFRIAVEERKMGETGLKLAIAVTVVTVAVISGVVLFKLSGDEGPQWQLEAGDSAAVRTGDSAPRALLPADPVLEARLLETQEMLQDSEEQQRVLVEQTVQLQEHNAALLRELEAARAELQTLREARPEVPAVAAEADPVAEPLAVEFGDWSELAELRDADWEQLGNAVEALSSDLIPRLVEALKAGKETQQLGIEVAKSNSKLQALALGLNGKLPTHSSGNGEFTHPIVLANLMVSHLEAAGQPLDERQLASLQALGAAFDSSWRRAQQNYNEGTFVLQKAMDELQLKADFYQQQLANLDASQRELLVHADFLNLYGIDLYSPVLMAPIQGFARGKDLEAIRTRLRELGGQRWQLAETDLEAVGTVFDTWLQQAGPLVPTTAAELSFVSLAAVLRAGRAQLQAMHDLVQMLGLDADAEAVLRDDLGLVVPRLLSE